MAKYSKKFTEEFAAIIKYAAEKKKTKKPGKPKAKSEIAKPTRRQRLTINQRLVKKYPKIYAMSESDLDKLIRIKSKPKVQPTVKKPKKKYVTKGTKRIEAGLKTALTKKEIAQLRKK